MSHPAADIDHSAATVRRLLDLECPSLAGESIKLVDEGWDNVMYRVGERHAVRLPRRQAAVSLLVNEQRWLPLLAARVPLETPVPVHVGQGNEWFPWPWSVVRWISGTTAEQHRCTPADVALLVETLAALHQPAPVEAPVNSFRGVPIRTKTDLVGERLARLGPSHGLNVHCLTAIWRLACAAPDATERVWLHGDLHPRNVVVRDGAVVGLIDWGDLNGGDASADVLCTWTLIDSPQLRQQFLDAYGADEALVDRAKGWAVHIGLALVDSGEARHVPMGHAVLERVLADV